MRRTTTLTALAALALTPLGLAAAPAVAAETCDGKVATIVVTPAADGHTTTPVTGTPGDDVVLGTANDDTIDGAGGNDTICGLAGADTLVGGDGNDRLFGGADSLYSADEGYYGDLLVPGPVTTSSTSGPGRATSGSGRATSRWTRSRTPTPRTA